MEVEIEDGGDSDKRRRSAKNKSKSIFSPKKSRALSGFGKKNSQMRISQTDENTTQTAKISLRKSSTQILPMKQTLSHPGKLIHRQSSKYSTPCDDSTALYRDYSFLFQYFNSFLCLWISTIFGATFLMVLGGWLFHVAEFDNYDKRIDYLFELENNVEQIFNSHSFPMEEIEIIQEYYFLKNRTKLINPWNFRGAVYFTATSISTVGYGFVCPQTIAGKTLLAIFLFFTIPIFLVMSFYYCTSCAYACHKIIFHYFFPPRDGSQAVDFEEDSIYRQAMIVAFLWLSSCALLTAFHAYYEDEWTVFDAWYFIWLTGLAVGISDKEPQHEYGVMGVIITAHSFACFLGAFILFIEYATELYDQTHRLLMRTTADALIHVELKSIQKRLDNTIHRQSLGRGANNPNSKKNNEEIEEIMGLIQKLEKSYFDNTLLSDFYTLKHRAEDVEEHFDGRRGRSMSFAVGDTVNQPPPRKISRRRSNSMLLPQGSMLAVPLTISEENQLHNERKSATITSLSRSSSAKENKPQSSFLIDPAEAIKNDYIHEFRKAHSREIESPLMDNQNIIEQVKTALSPIRKQFKAPNCCISPEGTEYSIKEYRNKCYRASKIPFRSSNTMSNT